MTDMNNIADQLITASRETIKTCDLITTRLRRKYCVRLDDGNVLTAHGVGIIPTKFGSEVAMRDTREAMAEVLATVKAGNPDNPVVGRLYVDTIQNAARKQREISEGILEQMQELKNNA